MLRTVFAFALSFLAAPAFAIDLPVFDEPKGLLDAIYAQYAAYVATDDYDPADYFDEEDAYSTDLKAALDAANERVWATGDEMGALDFSPFINGQDGAGQTFVVHDPKVKGTHAVADVDINFEGRQLYLITFHLVDEGGARRWKIDDILLPNGDSAGSWSLAEYFASLPAN